MFGALQAPWQWQSIGRWYFLRSLGSVEDASQETTRLLRFCTCHGD